jgi:glycosyltransferase involved in cell wall biosynthesis
MIAAPRVSVIIATYNRAGTVVEAIESVLRQSFRDLEIIVADDGSSDDTPERIAVLEGPIHHLRLPHTGLLARVRNSALRHAHGELIAFLDDDDSWAPEKLARQVAVIDADPAVGLVYTGFSVLSDDGSVHVPELAPWQTAPGPLLDRLLRGFSIHPSAVLVRRALLERVGGLDERWTPCEDYELLLRLAPLTGGVCIPEPLTRLRLGATNKSPRIEPLIYDVSISLLEEWLAVGGLDLRRRLLCRTAISNLHVSAARVAREAGDGRRARRHALAAIGRNPFKRRAWSALRLSVPAPDTASAP